MDSFTSANPKIQQSFTLDLETKYKKLERKASETIGSFAGLVDELIKLKELSKGTLVNKPIEQMAGELNNTSVFFTKMISEQLSKIYEVVTPNNTSIKDTTNIET